ncbi:TMV resistance protein N-like [Senna tora]|uniref:TMV resistance protein N-like n=1 Tax=Senna tora TaxID=362788 RepID=A0A834W4K5_9FABA|nr:TMV resistance protein N-like [Senna tora]
MCRLESELVEEIAKDVLEKLNRVHLGDIEEEIARYEELGKLQYEFAHQIPTQENFKNVYATNQRITQLKMERNLRMLRLTPDMLSHIQQSSEYEIVEKIAMDVLEKLNGVDVGDLEFKIGRLEELAQIQKEYSEQISSFDNTENYEATLKRIIQLQMEKKFRMLRLPPDLLSHMQISPKTKHYF